MAKRSPILGYNHNIRYRGVVFHVQTEDSGVLSPHLFTHLFHGGVIVSTRKLVYDAGANEEAIKALMQAQHKAVMKDLKRGTFDDKIDQYLIGVEGLEPRTTPAASASTPDMTPVPAAAPGEHAPAEAREATLRDVEHAPSRASAPPPRVDAPKPRTVTASRGSSTGRPGMPPPPSDALDPPTISDDAAALGRAPTVAAPQPSAGRVATARTPVRAGPPLPHARAPSEVPLDSSPEISISIEDEGGGRGRMPRDTEVEMPFEAGGIPGAVGDELTRPTDAVPWHAADTPSAPAGERRPPTGDRPPSHGAATLPPVSRPLPRPPSRPAISPPMVMSRPPQDGRGRDGDAVEVYAPAPPSVEPPPGERSERPGQYLVSRTKQHSIPADVPLREQRSRGAAPAGLGRPRAVSSGMRAVAAPSTPPARRAGEQASMRGAPPVEPARAVQSEPIASDRTPTPPRIPHSSTPRTGSPSQGGVVMTRPAVIVGAPNKGAPRVRKAREDEGRGFGQGLISEKSLDEVILAYLSEDAEDK